MLLSWVLPLLGVVGGRGGRDTRLEQAAGLRGFGVGITAGQGSREPWSWVCRGYGCSELR
ncbi:hypothetical protein SSPO_020290 [Streptomyces antimycoticus]|uniref:Uncharacterized protein n=1 Tax=Streptomyces antimycoticus TaxID=68175 RepID=A0A499UQ44_9ACTN|nr:hypothetical protein [Streptomyces antimycoticus]BBJ39311.1 hypothetical protein SSPO_020290 [Streptomyces antimycoticus]